MRDGAGRRSPAHSQGEYRTRRSGSQPGDRGRRDAHVDIGVGGLILGRCDVRRLDDGVRGRVANMIGYRRITAGCVWIVLILLTLPSSTGCRLSGTWHTSDFSPQPQRMHLDAITFSVDGRYTATDAADGRMATSTGGYSWNGLRLKLIDDGGGERAYPCSAQWGMRCLRIRNHTADDPWTALLRRSD